MVGVCVWEEDQEPSASVNNGEKGFSTEGEEEDVEEVEEESGGD